MAMSDKMRGKAEEMSGKMTNDKGMEMKGKARQTVAKTEEKLEDLRDKTKHRL